MGSKILLVEDDENLGRQVRDRLQRSGYEAQWLRDGKSALTLHPQDYALLVLDIMLPGVSGFEVLDYWRERSDRPVLILSALGDSEAKVRALEAGADDYLTKPFWPEELVARVRARLRRPALSRAGSIEAGPFVIDVDAHVAQMDGHVLDLTRVEFDLLAALARRAGASITRKWIVAHVLDPRRQGDERTLDVHVSRLRKKLGPHGKAVATVWGVGYRLDIADSP